MQRCIELAQLGAGNVAPNPLVGAVLVYEEKIIGEGYHEKYGEAHAEVNCINSVAEENIGLISKSILYVSLEPCSHFGKTPPCVDLILKYKIPYVIIACRDSFEKVNGTGIEKLKVQGVKVELGILENECITLNKIFFTFQEKKRPYIILKGEMLTIEVHYKLLCYTALHCTALFKGHTLPLKIALLRALIFGK